MDKIILHSIKYGQFYCNLSEPIEFDVSFENKVYTATNEFFAIKQRSLKLSTVKRYINKELYHLYIGYVYRDHPFVLKAQEFKTYLEHLFIT